MICPKCQGIQGGEIVDGKMVVTSYCDLCDNSGKIPDPPASPFAERISRRDWFAGMALQALLDRRSSLREATGGAWDFADAMIANDPQKGGG